MRKLILLIGCFLFTALFVLAQPPFQEGGKLFTTFFAGSPNINPSPWWVEDSLIARFGAVPSYILWDDLEDTSNTRIQIVWYPPYLADPIPPWWGDSLQWKDLRPYVTGLFTSMETGDTLVRDLPVGDPEEIVSINSAGKYLKTFGFDCDLLPVPNDGAAWKMEIIPTIDIFDSVEVDPNHKSSSIVIRMNPETPLDSLLWFRDTWADHLTDYQLHWEMLRHYPYYQPSLFILFDHYYDGVICDSVEFYGDRYIESLVNNMDQFSSEHSYPTPELGIDSVHVNTIQEMIDDICIDGQAQRNKYPPREIY